MVKILFSLATAAICLTCIEPSLIQITEQYFISDTNETFIQALGDCKLVGMELARIENASVQANLTGYLNSTHVSPASLYWLGGVHRSGDSWVWVETGRYISYTHWGVNEPHYSNNSDHCLQLGTDYGTNNSAWAWEAQFCTLPRYYICQK